MSPRLEWQIRLDQGTPVHISVVSIGSNTASVLEQYKHGYVLAVFDRSFYVQYEQHVICIGVASLGRGPIHLLIASAFDVLPFKVVSGMSFDLHVHSLHESECVTPGCYGSTDDDRNKLYSGKVSGGLIVSDSTQFIKETLKRLVPPPQLTGFGWILSSADWPYRESASLISDTGTGITDNALLVHSLATLKSIYHWLERALQTSPTEFQHPIPQAVPALLGAGPGLTPSGDDLLAGVMLALNRVQRADLAECLWQVLEPQLQHRTNVISGAHLRLAALGQCSEPVLSLIACIFNDTVLNNEACHHAADIQTTAIDIHKQADSIGASSGWDMLAGMSLVLRAS